MVLGEKDMGTLDGLSSLGIFWICSVVFLLDMIIGTALFLMVYQDLLPFILADE